MYIIWWNYELPILTEEAEARVWGRELLELKRRVFGESVEGSAKEKVDLVVVEWTDVAGESVVEDDGVCKVSDILRLEIKTQLPLPLLN